MKKITEKRLLKLGFEKEFGETCDVLDYHYEFWHNNEFLLATISFMESDYGLDVYFVDSPPIDLGDIIDINIKEIFDFHISDYEVLRKIIKKIK